MARASVSIAHAHAQGAPKNHAAHRSASAALLYFAAVLRTPDQGPPYSRVGEIMAQPSRARHVRRPPGRTEHLAHKGRLMRVPRHENARAPSRGRLRHAGDCQLQYSSITVMIAESLLSSSRTRTVTLNGSPTSGSARPCPTSVTAVQATNATSPQRNSSNTMNRGD
jgi:hypothetical protein